MNANWQADCPQCVASKFTCDAHYGSSMSVPFPAFADRLPAKLPTLRDLWLAAAEASEALSKANGEWSLEVAADNARRALIDHLLFEHGLTTADLRRHVL